MSVVTRAQLDRAVGIAKRDFQSVGLYSRALDEIPIKLTPWGEAYGYFSESGEIEIPAFSWSRVVERCAGVVCSLEDVLRHELAHALADRHMDLVDTDAFERVFGAAYWDEWLEPIEFDPRDYVTEYATTAPCEDFAETVMVYARDRGRVSRYAARRGVMRAFRYLGALAGALDSHRSFGTTHHALAASPRARRCGRIAAAFNPSIVR